jgi:PAS domain S-box-containing protein
MIDVPTTRQDTEKMLAMNEALVLGSLRLHELAEASDNLSKQLYALNAKLRGEIAERERTEALLSCQKKAFEMVAMGAPLMEVLEFLALAIERQSPQNLYVAIHLLDKSGTRFEQTAAPSLPPEYNQIVDGVAVSSAIGSCCAAVSQRRRVVVPDIAASTAWPAFAALALPLGLRAVWSTPIFSASGNVLGTFVSYCREVCEPDPQSEALDEIVTRTAAVCIERKQAETALLESQAFSQSVFEANPDCVKIIDVDGHIERMNANGQCLMEIDDFGAIAGAHWPSLWPPETRAEIGTAIAEAQAGRSGHFLGFCPTAKGTPRWWDVIVTAVPGASPSPVHLIAASRDITERKKAEERQLFLTKEIAHRGGNLLAVVQSMVARTLTGPRPLVEMREILSQRIMALSRGLHILLVNGVEGVSLGETIRSELEMIADQIEASGPVVMLNPSAAQTFALVVHELATNASKYGALSQPGGQVAMTWSIEGKAPDARFRFHWQERGGPPVEPPRRQGFGRMVLEDAAESAFGAAPQINFAPEGLRYELDVLLSDIAVA